MMYLAVSFSALYAKGLCTHRQDPWGKHPAIAARGDEDGWWYAKFLSNPHVVNMPELLADGFRHLQEKLPATPPDPTPA